MAFWKNIPDWMIWFYHFGVAMLLLLISFPDILKRRIQNGSNNELQGPKTSDNNSTFKVYMYEDELKYIKRLVLQKDNIETGGDLFGLWLDAHNVVVQFVLGPGKNCRRSTISFYQDIDYLGSVGNYLTKNHGLCNIGQWHSHHRLDLPRPSHGDENTVWNNVPTLGIERYVVFIATIKALGSGMTNTVDVNCFLFEIENETKLPVLEGEICLLKEKISPVREGCSELIALVESGMEDDRKHGNNNSVALDMELD